MEDGGVFLFGTDPLGRDLFTRTMYGARVSLSIGLVGVFCSFILGTMLGGISGYFGGIVDIIIQRTIELLISIPTIPLWMTLAAALPRDWPVVKNYFVITVILSVIGWGSLARVVRGKLLSLSPRTSLSRQESQEPKKRRSLPSICFRPLPAILSCRLRWPYHI